jgi:GntR family transcriptional regulator
VAERPNRVADHRSGRLDLPRPARGVAAYLQIAEELGRRIERAELPPRTRLPTERQLSINLGVSRMTVRQALANLEERNLLVRVQGSGTFVADPKVRQRATRLRGFFEQSVEQGIVPTSRTISRNVIQATPALADALETKPGDELYAIVRLRLAHDEPVVLERSFFPARLLPGLIDLDLDHGSLYRLMEERYHARPVRGVQEMESVPARREEADLLKVPPGTPLMLLERTGWDAVGRPVEHARDLYRGDRSRFSMELSL